LTDDDYLSLPLALNLVVGFESEKSNDIGATTNCLYVSEPSATSLSRFCHQNENIHPRHLSTRPPSSIRVIPMTPPSQLEQTEPKPSHRKSRTGCLTCKKRRVKCDESLPRCRKCAIRDRPCSYLTETSLSGSQVVSEAASEGARESRRTVEPASPYDAWLERSESLSPGTFTLLHMVLLNHAHTHVSELMGIEGDAVPLVTLAVKSASTKPYVLDQLLALSATHLSIGTSTSAAATYQNQATSLQTRALSLFNQARETNLDSSYLAAFLFASLLGIHVLHTTLTRPYANLSEFIPSFVEYVRLHRGVRAVTKSHWQQILDSDLKPLLYISELALQAETMPAGSETEFLRRVLTSPSHLSASSVDVCLSALKWIQWMLDMAKLQPCRADVAVQAVMAWPLVVSEEYVDALYQHRPEAFVVFAYYAAALHRCRGFWAFSNAGPALVRMIAQHVGPFWTESLIWPQRALLED
jgi:hypothetical protein